MNKFNPVHSFAKKTCLSILSSIIYFQIDRDKTNRMKLWKTKKNDLAKSSTKTQLPGTIRVILLYGEIHWKQEETNGNRVFLKEHKSDISGIFVQNLHWGVLKSFSKIKLPPVGIELTTGFETWHISNCANQICAE